MKWVSKGKKKTYSIERLRNSFKNAFSGIVSAYKTEQNLLIHSIGLLVNIALFFLLKLSLIEICIILFLCFLIISLEMVNTAIEYSVDMAMPQIHPLAKISKDVASGAVLISCIGAIIIGLIIYLPKIIAFF